MSNSKDISEDIITEAEKFLESIKDKPAEVTLKELIEKARESTKILKDWVEKYRNEILEKNPKKAE